MAAGDGEHVLIEKGLGRVGDDAKFGFESSDPVKRGCPTQALGGYGCNTVDFFAEDSFLFRPFANRIISIRAKMRRTFGSCSKLSGMHGLAPRLIPFDGKGCSFAAVALHVEGFSFADRDLVVEGIADQGDGAGLGDAQGGVKRAVFDMDALDAGLVDRAFAAALCDVARAAAGEEFAVCDAHEFRAGAFDVFATGGHAVRDIVAGKPAVIDIQRCLHPDAERGGAMVQGRIGIARFL